MHEKVMQGVADSYGRGMRETPDREGGACLAARCVLGEAGRFAAGVACPGSGDLGTVDAALTYFDELRGQ